MQRHDHLKLPLFQGNIERQTRGGGGGFKMPQGRNKAQFSQRASQIANDLSRAFSASKKQLSGRIDPTLIFEIEINQSISSDAFEETLTSMGIHVLSVAEGKKGFWVVFSEDGNLSRFKQKLETYGSEKGYDYSFFHAIESFGAIPVVKKIGKQLAEQPLTDTADYIDIELWKIDDPQKNEHFIQQLKDAYDDFSQFRITDQLITKSFVLLRVKLNRTVFDEIIQLKEIARADRPAIVQFNPFEMMRPDVDGIEFDAPEENATGILVIDSGIVSNHPMLEKCVGGEENFQSGEKAVQDTVGHGTGVAGCAVYGNIEDSLDDKIFTPSNWLFSAKVMYAERNLDGNVVGAVYDEKKLIEHQLKDAVESFLSNPEYHIKVVNISLGNSNEVWHKHYSRQLPLAALIDELAFIFSHVVFVVSVGNYSPRNVYDSIADIIENYPCYLIGNKDFKIINPASSALALSIGSIAGEVKIGQERPPQDAEQIKTPIAQAGQPSPFTRTGMGINGMIKPELVEYGGNLILSESNGHISEDIGGKLALLNNRVTGDIIRFDTGTSFAAPKVARLAGKIANSFPEKSANFIKNMLLVGAVCPFEPDDHFYGSIPDEIGIKKYENEILEKIDSEDVIVSNAYQKSERHYVLKSDVTETARKDISAIFKEIKFKSGLGLKDHLSVCGYGLSSYERALYSFDNRAVLWDEGQIRLNQIKVYSLELPEIFFKEAGKKKITVTLTFTPETRATRGDSYLGNHMEFHLFHSINPQTLIGKYGVISEDVEQSGVPDELKTYEIDFFPGANIRKAGCHQKAWKLYKNEPKSRPESPVSLVLLNFNKWITDDSREQNYCVSVTFEHEKEIDLYNTIRTNIQTRTRVR
jgi:Subtilase family